MARQLAINAVAEAVVTALNVSSIRAVCGGGVYRNRPPAQTPPFITVGPCRETFEDAFGTHYGSAVEVPVSVVTSGADANGESRAVDILNAVVALLDEPAVFPALTGWSAPLVGLQEVSVTAPDALATFEGAPEYTATAVFVFRVGRTA